MKVVGSETAQDEGDGRSQLDEIAREGAPRRLVAALETEVAAYLEAHRNERDDEGHALVVCNGRGRTRKVTVGAGTIPVSAPRVNDRRTDQDGERRRFTSRILPPYMRRSPKVAEVLPVLYLRGLSTGDFRDALAALLGDDAAGLSATNIARLTNEWETEYRAFQKRSLADRDYVYVWVDGVHFNVRLEDDRPRTPRGDRAVRHRVWCQAVTTLEKDADVLLTFFDFPAEHWKHMRTSNVIESPFATVRLRQRVTKGAGSRTKGLLMAYKLLDMAQARWRRLDGAHLLPLVRAGTDFVDGVQQKGKASKTRARAA